MTLVQVGHHDALALGDRTIDADELAVLAHGVDLVQRQLVLWNAVASAMRKSWLWYGKRTG